MNDYPLLKIGIIFLILGGSLFFLWSTFGDGVSEISKFFTSGDGEFQLRVQYSTKWETIEIHGRDLSLEVADTPEKTRKGLSGRDFLEVDEGMLFLFNDTRKHVFWMNGMEFPLDIIWLRDGEVVEIVKNLPAPDGTKPPAVHTPSAEANQVIEINAGYADIYTIRVGDVIEDLR